MNQIETGYKPEFALGALYQGQNAANAQSQNDQELIKRFLENQHTLVNNPITEEKNRLGLDPARYESLLSRFKMEDPNYIPAQLEGQIGQMNTQAAAGTTAKALQPFMQEQKIAESENEKARQGFLWTINDIDQKLQAGGGQDENGVLHPFTSRQRAFMEQKRQEITDSLKNTAEFAGKKELSEDKINAMLEAAELRAQAATDAANQRTARAETESQLMARLYHTAYTDPNATQEQKQAALAAINARNIDRLSQNPLAYATPLDVGAMGKMPQKESVLDQARKNVPKPPSLEDQAAMGWALANPTDPRSAEILRKLANK